jgi:NAD-dependent dihydropyrimidine dehydrogenase PreA subunit
MRAYATTPPLIKEQFFMAYVITDACTKDFVCATECATSAIAPQVSDANAETVPHLFINPDDCIDCGSCASLCSQQAIFSENDLPADKAHFAEEARAYFQ